MTLNQTMAHMEKSRVPGGVITNISELSADVGTARCPFLGNVLNVITAALLEGHSLSSLWDASFHFPETLPSSKFLIK